MPNRQVTKQRPARKFQRPQRTDWRSNDLSGIPWGQGNWPGGGGGVGDPQISSIAPSTLAATAGPTTLTITGTQFVAGSVVEFDQVAQTTTFVSATSLTISFDPTIAHNYDVTVRNPNEEESNTVSFVVTATVEEEPQAMSAETKPTSSWLKADIIAWLVEFGGYEEEGLDAYTKAELLEYVDA